MCVNAMLVVYFNIKSLTVLFILQVLVSFILLFLPVWMGIVVSILMYFFVPGMMLSSLFLRKTPSLIELSSQSILVGSIITPLLVMLLGVLVHPVTYWHFISAVLVFSLSLIIARVYLKISPTSITTSKTEIAWFATTFLCIFTTSAYLSSRWLHWVTPDENFHLNAARIFLQTGKIFPIGYDILASEFSYILTSRFVVSLQFASKMASLPEWSESLINLGSLLFLFGLCLATSQLLYCIKSDVARSPMILSVPVLVSFNPLLFVLSSYALSDLIVAFYSVYLCIFFLNSFEAVGPHIRPNYVNFLKVMAVAFVTLLVKINLALVTAAAIIFVFYILKYRWYTQRIFGMLFTITVAVVALFISIDIYRIILIYLFGLSRSSLEIRYTYTFYPYSLLELFNFEKLTEFSLAQYLWVLNVVLSPQNLSVVGLSAFILSMFNSLTSKSRTGLQVRLLAGLTLGALVISYVHALQFGFESFVMNRYYAFLIPMVIVLALSYFHKFIDYVGILQMAVVSVSTLLMLFILNGYYPTLPFSYLAISRKVLDFDIPIFHLLLFSLTILVTSLCILCRGSGLLKTFLRVVPKISKTPTSSFLVKFVLISAIVANFLVFSTSAFHSSVGYRYPDLKNVSSAIPSDSVVVTSLHVIDSFLSNKYDNVVWIMPPPEEQFAKLVSSLPNGTLLLTCDHPLSYGVDAYVGDYFSKRRFATKFEEVEILFLKKIGEKCDLHVAINKGTQLPYKPKLSVINHSWKIEISDSSKLDDAYILLKISLLADVQYNATLVISSERFSRVYPIHLQPGINEVILKFANKYNGLHYGNLIARMARIVLLSDSRQILHSEVMGLHVFRPSNTFTYAILLLVPLNLFVIPDRIQNLKKTA